MSDKINNRPDKINNRKLVIKNGTNEQKFSLSIKEN